MLGLVILNGVIVQFVQQQAVHDLIGVTEVFTGQYTDVWNKVCWISCFHNISLLHVVDNHIQNISSRILDDLLDIGIFLLPHTVIDIGPKNPISVGPYHTLIGLFTLNGWEK